MQIQMDLGADIAMALITVLPTASENDIQDSLDRTHLWLGNA